MISILIRLLSSLLKVTAFSLTGTFEFQGFSFTSEIWIFFSWVDPTAILIPQSCVYVWSPSWDIIQSGQCLKDLRHHPKQSESCSWRHNQSLGLGCLRIPSGTRHTNLYSCCGTPCMAPDGGFEYSSCLLQIAFRLSLYCRPCPRYSVHGSHS